MVLRCARPPGRRLHRRARGPFRAERTATVAATSGLLEQEAELVSLSDEELIRRTYLLVRELDDLDPDDLYFQLDEVFERFAPDLALRDRQRASVKGETDEKAIERELAAIRKRFDRRADARRVHVRVRAAIEDRDDV